jgi:23S rRNA (guanine745-N1)-methyltransferase
MEEGMLDDVVRFLRCPYCGGSLSRLARSLRCLDGHSFDIARQGYVSLLQTQIPAAAGDTAAMIRARSEFLGLGHFAPVAAVLGDAAATMAGTRATTPAAGNIGCVADLGAGTGYYLASVLARLPVHSGLALDISKPALRAAARAHPRIGAIRCDAWRPLPVADAAADLILNVFAPRDVAELRRILRPSGRLLVVTPGPDHLSELIGPLGLLSVDERKDERLANKLGLHFDLVSKREIRRRMVLDRRAAGALAAMGPSAWHAEPDVMADLIARLPEPVQVTLATTVTELRPRS